MSAYYNEFEPYAAQWLRNLIKKGLIADGEVDERSITDVHPHDLKGFNQCHFFAGIGGWSYAARLAGWSDERPLWTGSAPCQPFSSAGRQEGQKDDRHLWPKFFELIRFCRPTTVMGEQVSAAIRFGWLDGVSSDLESEGYSTGAVIIPACAVNAPHRRDRLWFIADNVGNAEHNGQSAIALRERDAEAIQHNEKGQDIAKQPTGASAYVDVSSSVMADTECVGQPRQGQLARSLNPTASCTRQADRLDHDSPREFWRGSEYIAGPDGKARRIEPSIRLLAHGIPARVGKLRAYGNAIVPQVAAEIIKSYMACNT